MDDETPGEVIHLPRLTGASASKRVPAAIQKLILELGLRFRPLGQADQDAYRQKLALLANDCADVPADILRRAIDHYVKGPDGTYLPKAAQLISLAQNINAQRSSAIGPGGATVEDLHRHVAWLNERNFVIDSGKPYFVRLRDDGLHEVARTT